MVPVFEFEGVVKKSAKRTTATNEQPKKSVYVELFGNGFLYSINYERIVYLDENWKLMPRGGISFGKSF